MTKIEASIDRRNEKTKIERERVTSAEEIVREWQRKLKIDFENQKKEKKKKIQENSKKEWKREKRAKWLRNKKK